MLQHPLNHSTYIEDIKTRLINNFENFPNENVGDDNAIVTWDGYRRLSMMETIIREIIIQKIDGDICEAGVYKGGMTILFAALLKENNVNKKVYNFDTFQGIPYNYRSSISSADEQTKISDRKWGGKLKYKLHKVKRNFETFNLLDDNIIFVEGLFKDTLPITNVETLSLLRVDCDMYQSTYEVLHYLYPKLVVGGYVVFDDYKFQPCKKAIEDYRKKYNISTEYKFGLTIDPIMYWIKSDISG